MECDPTDDRPIVVDISSDEGSSSPIVASSEDFDWLGELLCKDVDEGLAAEEDSDDVVVIGEFRPLDKSRKQKLDGSDYRDDVVVDDDDDDDDDDDECLVLDGDPDKLAAVEGEKGNDNGSESDDLLVVGEKGQVACRDYPHPRHDCVKFPFNTTSHEKHCDLCHCYVCDSLAPCIYWGTGISNSDHCHATNKDGDWKIRRKDLKLVKSAGQNTFSIDNGTAQIVMPLPNQTIHHGRMPSAANLTLQNHVSLQLTIHHAGQTIIPGSTTMPTNLTPQNLVPRQAIYRPPNKTSLYGNTTSPVNSFLARPSIFQKCSSSATNCSSNNIYGGARKRQPENFKIGPQPHYAPGRLSHPNYAFQPDGRHLRSNIRPQHASSVPRFNKPGIVYRPSASRAGSVSNNPSQAPQVQCKGKFPKYTSTNACHNKILRQSSQLGTDFPSDVRSGLCNSAGTLPNMVSPHSSGFCRPSGGISEDARNLSPIYQQIEDATPLNPLDHACHQNQGTSLHREAETMESATVSQRHQPIQQSNHQLTGEFDLGSVAMNDNWWAENELPQGQVSWEPPASSVDVGDRSKGRILQAAPSCFLSDSEMVMRITSS